VTDSEDFTPPEEWSPGGSSLSLWASSDSHPLDALRLLETTPKGPRFPSPGEQFADFQLVAELGSGADGRVYLATQLSLADRQVVLKLSPRTGREHLSLARLQHTHIVPLYAVHDDPERNLRSLCMPYFGSATLARLLEAMREIPWSKRDGKQLLAALDAVQAVPLPPPARSPGRHLLARVDYVQALCWITAGLAEGLHYAHERGVVHFDVKPSNVLLSADGQPMLLDFHLAHPPIRPDGPPPEWLGGTISYMAQEQWNALSALREGRKLPAPVDSRADLFSLGAMLYEALGGKLPAQANVSPPLHRLNPDVSLGLSDVVRKCLAKDPRDRYPDGRSLATDLVRHLDNLPLRGVYNRSLFELWAKWRRRKPGGVARIALALAALGMAGVGGYHLLHRYDHQRDQVQTLLQTVRQHLSKGDASAAEQPLNEGLALAEELPNGQELTNEFRCALQTARQYQAVNELHSLTDRVRFLYPCRDLTGPAARDLADRCRSLWDKRTLVLDLLGAEATPAVRRRTETDLLDLAILTADLHAATTPPTELKKAREESLRILVEAETLFGPSPVLAHECARYARALGLEDPPGGASARQPETTWEHYALGRSYLQANDLVHAAEHLEKAVTRQPHDLWPNFYMGQCAYLQHHYEEAVVAFSVCVGAAPEMAPCYFNRALARAALGHKEQAVRDYDQALRLDPALGAAYLNRAVLHSEAGRLAEAEADLHQALERGADPAAVHFNVALVLLASNDRPAALNSLREALQHDPNHAEARNLLELLTHPHPSVKPK
jgi:serine/threonine protein kinase/tetratricopeptide (TPR) repeat protein